MARKSRKTTNKSRGSTLFGIMVGLILGLVAAVVVALFVTQAPMPFVDKASREPSKTVLPDLRNAPDPNIGLNHQSGSEPVIQQNIPDSSPPTVANSSPSGDNLGEFISELAKPKPEPTKIPGVTESSNNNQPKQLAANTQTTYYLQAGAFKSKSDAEAMQARILMLGLQTQVQTAEINGTVLNRVRVGPFSGIDAMNKARSQLGQENIETAVIRP